MKLKEIAVRYSNFINNNELEPSIAIQAGGETDKHAKLFLHRVAENAKYSHKLIILIYGLISLVILAMIISPFIFQDKQLFILIFVQSTETAGLVVFIKLLISLYKEKLLSDHITDMSQYVTSDNLIEFVKITSESIKK